MHIMLNLIPRNADAMNRHRVLILYSTNRCTHTENKPHKQAHKTHLKNPPLSPLLRPSQRCFQGPLCFG